MNVKKFIISLAIPLIVGTIVGLIIMPFMDYKTLEQPPLSPPSIVFPIVWTILYLLMGVSAYLINVKEKVPTIYYLQLGVNALWPIAFFALKLRLFAFIWLILLIILVIDMIITFAKISKKAAYIQIPYLIWCIFASYLNLGIYLLN